MKLVVEALRRIEVRPRADRTVLSASRTVLVSDLAGKIADPRAHGLWVDETRLVSRWVWRLAGAEPEPCGASTVAQSSWALRAIVGAPRARGQATERAIGLRLARALASGMHEDVDVTNHTARTVRVPLELELGCDFADPLEVRGPRKQNGRVRVRFREAAGGWELAVRYDAVHAYAHGRKRGTSRIVRGVRVRIAAPVRPRFAREARGGRVRFDLALAPGASFHACVRVVPHAPCEPRDLALPCPLSGEDPWMERRRAWLDAATRIDVPDPRLAEVIERAREDLCDLRMHDLDGADGAFTVAAGVPTYVTLFGRDTLVTAIDAAMLGPEIGLGSLRALARTQAARVDDWRDAVPGRIAHEVHTGPLAALEYDPHGLYYGDFTAQALFASAVARMWRYTGDRGAIEPLVPVAVRAIESIDRASLGKDGLYRYRTRSPQGEKNQGWRDSASAIVDVDGARVPDPLGTCAMQAFVYRAKLDLADLKAALGEPREARALRADARRLARRVGEAFWMEDEGTVGLATDARGRLVRSITSDVAHVLAAGILPAARAALAARRMLMADLFSGWGLRTLSSRHFSYSPFAYHRGTVWPIETCAAVVGLCRYRRWVDAWRLARALFDLARLFEGSRLPEVVGGDARDDAHPFPNLYPRAGWPQAWSSAAVFGVLEALLGLVPDAAGRALVVDPHLPPWLPRLRLEGLRVGSSRVDLAFERTPGGETEVAVERGDLTVRRARRASGRRG